MKKFLQFVLVAIALLIVQGISYCQGSVNDSLTGKSNFAGNSYKNSWGVDILVSTNGFGLGGFYRHEYTPDLAGFIDFSISESKDDREFDSYNPYTGETFVVGKINRFLVLPIYAGVQYRLFSDDIMDNFRPYVSGALGPSLIYVFPYNDDYFTALGHGQFKYTAGGYLGFGAFFGSERSTLFGLDIRYYVVPYSGGIASMQQATTIVNKSDFGGFVISFNVGKAW